MSLAQLTPFASGVDLLPFGALVAGSREAVYHHAFGSRQSAFSRIYGTPARFVWPQRRQQQQQQQHGQGQGQNVQTVGGGLESMEYSELLVLLMAVRQLLSFLGLAPVWPSPLDLLAEQLAVAVLLCLVPVATWQLIVASSDPVASIRALQQHHQAILEMVKETLRSPENEDSVFHLMLATDPEYVSRTTASIEEGKLICVPFQSFLCRASIPP